MEKKLDRVQIDSIIRDEGGILARQGRGFHFCTPFARENLYHLSWSDEYICDDTYRVDRDYLNCFLLMNLVSGKMTLQAEGKQWTLGDSELVLLDLKKPHIYQADTKIQVQQYMLNGGALPAYYKHLTEKDGPVFRKDSRLQFLLSSLKKESLAPMPDDHVISMLITNILCSLSGSMRGRERDPVRQAQYYINDHYREELTLEDIADAVSLSKYYFSRMFEKEVGTTPWEFLIQTRLRNAMQMLTHTSASVDEIAEFCGFATTNHFIRSFKSHTNFTPGAFRKHFNDVPMGYMVDNHS